MHASLVSSALALEYRSTTTLTRQTGVVSGDLCGQIPQRRNFAPISLSYRDPYFGSFGGFGVFGGI